jgi:hypothetical protein
MKRLLRTFFWGSTFAVLGAPAARGQTPPTGIDPAIVRVNASGAEMLGSQLAPYLLEQAGLDDFIIAPQTLYDETFEAEIGRIENPPPLPDIPGIVIGQIRLRCSIRDTHVRIPLNADSVNIAFAGGSGETATVGCAIDAPLASVTTVIRVQVSCDSPLLDQIPADLRPRFNMVDDFHLQASGGHVDASVTMWRTPQGGWAVNVSQLQAMIEQISVTDSGWLDDIFNFLGRGACAVLGQPGSDCTVNTAVTRLANHLLRGADSGHVRNCLASALADAIQGAGDIGGSLTLPAPNNNTVTLSAALASLHSGSNWFLSDWNLDVATTGGAWRDLAYSYLARDAQNPVSEPPQGNLQVWLPLALVDKAGWALLKSGLLSGAFQIPRFSVNVGAQTVVVPATNVRINDPQVPRAERDSTREDRVLLRFRTGIVAVNAAANVNLTVEVRCRFQILLSDSDLRWQLASTNGSIVGGTVQYNGYTLQWDQLPASVRSAIQTALNTQWSQQAGTYTLMPRVLTLGHGWALELADVSVGNKYVRVALNLHHSACLPGDLDADGAIGLSDLTILMAHFGATGAVQPRDGDLDGDQDVDLQDLTELLATFGASCG